VDTDFAAELGELDKPSKADSGYVTTHATISFADDLHDSEDSIFPYPEASTYLYGIRHWLEDESRTGSTWTVWQDPNILFQQSYTLSSASIKKKPHVGSHESLPNFVLWCQSS
jgi:hypothetical protein